MLKKRASKERGPSRNEWLDSKHSFSFGEYYDPSQMGFGALRVINEDRVKAGAGFATHPHKNMEIISYVIKGELTHKDSMGNGSSIRPGEVQVMSAGSGVTHSEYNGSSTEEVHFLQIWIEPNVLNEKPGYQQKLFIHGPGENRFITVASEDGQDGALKIKQDARVMMGRFSADSTLALPTQEGRQYWLQVVRGEAEVNGINVSEGDGLAVYDEQTLSINVPKGAELVLFDLHRKL